MVNHMVLSNIFLTIWLTMWFFEYIFKRMVMVKHKYMHYHEEGIEKLSLT